MEKEVLIAIVGSLTAVCIAVGGWIFSWKMQDHAKDLERKEKKINRLKGQVESLKAIEAAAVDMIVKLEGKGEKGVGVRNRLRGKARERTGHPLKLPESGD